MASHPLLTLVLAATVVMGSPGPTTISMTAVAAAFGARRSLPYLCGLILGTTVVLLTVATGLAAMLLSVPQIAPVLIAASAAYILYLAYRVATAPPLSRHDESAAAPSLTGGFALAVANPKAYVAIAAVFAGTTLAEAGTADTVVKTVVLAGMIVVIHVCWLLAGTSFRRVLYDPAMSRIANLAFAAILVATVVLAFLE
jgi:threonine/homoserine/homoserine lactone efflux protein